MLRMSRMHLSIAHRRSSILHSGIPLPVRVAVPAKRSIVAATSSNDATSSPTAVLAKFSSPTYLTQAAKRYRAGLEVGLEADDLVALELGASSLEALTPLQLQYKDKIQKKLDERLEELEKEEKEDEYRMSRNLVLGKERYECGEYPGAVSALEQAVEDAGALTNIGGEAQLWLALSYQAVGREQDAIQLYLSLEQTHPNRKIKKQAYELRYIAEAPVLPLSEDERVKIPLLETDFGRRKSTYVPKFMPKAPVPAKDKSKETYWDRFDWRAPAGPRILGTDKWYYRVLWLALAVGTVVYLNWSLLHR